MLVGHNFILIFHYVEYVSLLRAHDVNTVDTDQLSRCDNGECFAHTSQPSLIVLLLSSPMITLVR